MRKRFLLLTLLLITLAVQPSFAQDDDPCSVENLQGQVDEILAAYEANSEANQTPDAALASVAALRESLDEVYAQCADIAGLSREEAESLITMLREGGYVIYVRHTETDRTQVDTNTHSCENQRNLTEHGREQAAEIGEAWTAIGASLSRIVSTEYCRTFETAQLAFGPPQLIPRYDLQVAQVLISILSTPPEAGTNVVVVAHIGTLRALTGLSLGEGDAIIFEPLDNREYREVGRILVTDWAFLGQVAAEMVEAEEN